MPDRVEYREIRPEELAEYVELDAYAFAYEATPVQHARYQRLLRLEDTLAAFVDGRMVAHLNVIDMRMWLNGAGLHIGGVSDVAAWPEVRRQGYTGEMLRRMLVTMRERGQSVSTLYPSFFALYRRFGYAIAEQKLRVTGPAAAFRRHREAVDSGSIRRIDVESWQRCASIYDRTLPTANGLVSRDEQVWRDRVIDAMPPAVMLGAVWESSAGVAEGYVIHRRPTQMDHYNDHQFAIRELVSLTPDAYAGLWTFIERHDLGKSITWTGPSDDPLLSALLDPGAVETSLQPGFMLRIVDLPGAIEARANPDPGPFAITLQVRDRTAPWNDGIWRIEREQGATRVSNTSAEPDSSLDITTLSAMFNGFLSAHSAHEAGLLEGATEAVIAISRLFPVTRRPYCADSF